MNTKRLAVWLFACFFALGAKAQITNIDSAAVAKTLTQLAMLSKASDFATAAKFIVYTLAADKTRSWNDVSDYSKPGENVWVESTCKTINNTINQDENYRITGYIKEDDDPQRTMYILQTTYVKNGTENKSEFYFIKINGRFALSQIAELN